jgi:hypothetical protein
MRVVCSAVYATRSYLESALVGKENSTAGAITKSKWEVVLSQLECLALLHCVCI